MARQRCKYLLAVDDPAALDGFGLGAKGRSPGRGGPTLRKWLRIDRSVRDDALVVNCASALVLGARCHLHVQIIGKRSRPKRRADMHVPGQRRCAAIAADFGRSERIGLIIRSKTAMPLWYRDAKEACSMQIVVVFRWKFCVPIVRRRAVREYGLAKFTRSRNDAGLLAT